MVNFIILNKLQNRYTTHNKSPNSLSLYDQQQQTNKIQTYKHTFKGSWSSYRKSTKDRITHSHTHTHTAATFTKYQRYFRMYSRTLHTLDRINLAIYKLTSSTTKQTKVYRSLAVQFDCFAKFVKICWFKKSEQLVSFWCSNMFLK